MCDIFLCFIYKTIDKNRLVPSGRTTDRMPALGGKRAGLGTENVRRR